MDGTFEVRDNVFAFDVSNLMNIGCYSEEFSRVFYGNTYARLPGFPWATTYEDNSCNRVKYADPTIAVVEWLCDEEATVIFSRDSAYEIPDKLNWEMIKVFAGEL